MKNRRKKSRDFGETIERQASTAPKAPWKLDPSELWWYWEITVMCTVYTHINLFLNIAFFDLYTNGDFTFETHFERKRR